MRTYKYRIYPTKNQRAKLGSILDECRWLYNYFLEQRKSAYEKEKKSLSHYDQMAQLPVLKETRPSLKVVYAQTLQSVAERLDFAFNGFFRRVKGGETPGYPRFKSADRFNSFIYPQTNIGFKLIGDHKISLSKIGHVRIKLHRSPPTVIKTCTVKRSPSGKWFVCLVGESTSKKLQPLNTQVAVDVGIQSFATLSDGTKIDNPKFLKKSEAKLTRAQRKLSKLEKGTAKRAKQKRVVCRVHEKIKNRRTDFAHKVSRQLVNQFGAIFVEDIQANKFIKAENLRIFNKCQQDAAWSQFFNYLTYKAEEAGRLLVRVNPAYTSQDCSRCGTRKLVPLEARVYHCDVCGLGLDRDHNAALNILRLGTQSLARKSLNNART